MDEIQPNMTNAMLIGKYDLDLFKCKIKSPTRGHN